MKKIFLLLAVCISFSTFARIGEMKVNPKTVTPKRTDIVCCEIFHLIPANDIRINKICLGKGKTVIEMEFTKTYVACTILESNTLVDNNGKQYKPIYHSGLSNCPKLTPVRDGHKFFWGFEALDTSALNLKLKEDETMHPNMIALDWTEINISHCKW